MGLPYLFDASSFLPDEGFESERHTDVQCPNHINDSMEIVLVSEGELQMTIGGAPYVIGAGQGIFVLPFEQHAFRTSDHSVCHVMVFSPDDTEPFSDFFRQNYPKTRVFKIPHALVPWIDAVLPERKNWLDRRHSGAVTAPLCTVICDECTFVAGVKAYDDTFLVALRYINEAFRDGITLGEVAQKVGVHPVTLSRMFNRFTHMGFAEYIALRRACAAASLLEKNELSISEIAFSSGFGSIRNFNRVFLHCFSKTPREYREERIAARGNVSLPKT